MKTLNQVFGNQLRKIREARQLTLKQLSDRMGQLGRPIGIASIAKLETAQRAGVDINDLVAFSIALNVSPTFMLIEDEWSPVEVVPGYAVKGIWLRDWLAGELPIPPDADLDEFFEMADHAARRRHRVGMDRAFDAVELLRAVVVEAILGPEAVVEPQAFAAYLKDVLQQASAHVDLLADDVAAKGYSGRPRVDRAGE